MLRVALGGIKSAWQLQSVNLIITYIICMHFSYIIAQCCIFNGIFLYYFRWTTSWSLEKSGYATFLFVTMRAESYWVLGVGVVF